MLLSLLMYLVGTDGLLMQLHVELAFWEQLSETGN
jgi:hypothetical protein